MSPPTVLDEILASTRAEVARRRLEVPVAELERRIEPGRRRGAFTAALAAEGIGVIAEHKRRSPSAGVLRADQDDAGAADGRGAAGGRGVRERGVREIVRAYADGGAVALSVLTEGPHFDGSLEDLAEARAAVDLPVLRKDFTVSEYQLYEAAAWGADAVLLIVAALGDGDLRSLATAARDLDLDVLVEVHDARELERALALGEGFVLGVNNRDLHDFSVDVGRTLELVGRLPAPRPVVSESGIATRGQLDELAAAGVAAVLVGESLMRARDPEAATRALAGVRGPSALTRADGAGGL